MNNSARRGCIQRIFQTKRLVVLACMSGAPCTQEKLSKPDALAIELQAFMASPSLASYFGLQRIDALHMPVPLSIIFVGFSGDGNMQVKLTGAELTRCVQTNTAYACCSGPDQNTAGMQRGMGGTTTEPNGTNQSMPGK